MSKIIGVTVGTPLPKPNLTQNDPTKGDYVKGKEEFLNGYVKDSDIEQAVTDALEQVKENGEFGSVVYILSEGETIEDAPESADVVIDPNGEDDSIGVGGVTPHIGANGNWYIGETDTGKPSRGSDGKTPVKGTDYWTSADKTEMVNSVLVALPTWTGGSY